MFIVLLFAIFGARGLRTAFRCNDPFSAPGCVRHHAYDFAAGLLQHQRGAVAGAQQGHSAAADLARRHVAVLHAGIDRDSAEYQPAGRLKRQGIRDQGNERPRTPRRICERGSFEILIAGGGTGGHIIPALAVARELVERHNAEILLVGTARGLESRLVPEAGFNLKLIDVGPLNSVSLRDAGANTGPASAGQHPRLQAADPRVQARRSAWRRRLRVRSGHGGRIVD